jgi:hypothetical protein
MHEDSIQFEDWPSREQVFELLKEELGQRSQSIVVSMSNIFCNNNDSADNSQIQRSTEMIEIFVKTVKKCKQDEVFPDALKNIFSKKR